MNKSEFYLKYRFIIWPTIVGIAVILVLALVIIPQILTYLQVKDKIYQTQNKSQNLEVKANELANIDNVATQKDLKVVFSILPTDQDVPKAMLILQSMVAQSGLELKSTSFGSSGSSSQNLGKNSFKLNIIVSGQITLLRDFFIQLQNASRLFQVESIGVQFKKTQGVIEAEIPLSVFYQPSLGEIGPLNQPLPKLSDTEKELLATLYQSISQSNISLNNAESSSSSIPLGKSDPFE